MAIQQFTKPTNNLHICHVSGCLRAVSCSQYCEIHYSRLRRHGSPDITLVTRNTEATFWNKVAKYDENECWEWQGCIDKASGYGIVGYHGKRWRVHRLAWALTNQREPRNHILHSCDNRKCVNPCHLREGTPAENTQDMRVRNRNAKNKVLNWAKVSVIRQLLANGQSERNVAMLFAVSRGAISKIKRGQSWQPLPEPYTEGE